MSCLLYYFTLFFIFDNLKGILAPWPPSLIVLRIKMQFFQEVKKKIFTNEYLQTQYG